MAATRRSDTVDHVATVRPMRNAGFLLTVVENSAENGAVFCGLPNIPAGPVRKFIVHQMAAVAELEAGLISQRTKVALAVAKNCGTALGGYNGGLVVDRAFRTKTPQERPVAFAIRVEPMIADMQQQGLSLHIIAAKLTSMGVKTPRGGVWTAAVRNVTLWG